MATTISRQLGEVNHQSKLTSATVKEARQHYQEAQQAVKELRSEFGIQGLADRYGVGFSTMRKALLGETWGHVE